MSLFGRNSKVSQLQLFQCWRDGVEPSEAGGCSCSSCITTAFNTPFSKWPFFPTHSLWIRIGVAAVPTSDVLGQSQSVSEYEYGTVSVKFFLFSSFFLQFSLSKASFQLPSVSCTRLLCRFQEYSAGGNQAQVVQHQQEQVPVRHQTQQRVYRVRGGSLSRNLFLTDETLAVVQTQNATTTVYHTSSQLPPGTVYVQNVPQAAQAQYASPQPTVGEVVRQQHQVCKCYIIICWCQLMLFYMPLMHVHIH